MVPGTCLNLLFMCYHVSDWCTVVYAGYNGVAPYSITWFTRGLTTTTSQEQLHKYRTTKLEKIPIANQHQSQVNVDSHGWRIRPAQNARGYEKKEKRRNAMFLIRSSDGKERRSKSSSTELNDCLAIGGQTREIFIICHTPIWWISKMNTVSCVCQKI